MKIKTTNMILEKLEKIHKEFLNETIERKSLLYPKSLDFYFNKKWVAVEEMTKELRARKQEVTDITYVDDKEAEAYELGTHDTCDFLIEELEKHLEGENEN